MTIPRKAFESLLYLHDLERSGIHLDEAQFNAYFAEPNPQEIRIRNPEYRAGISAMMGMSNSVPEFIRDSYAETGSAYLQRLGWAHMRSNKMHLTDVGRILVENELFKATAVGQDESCFVIGEGDIAAYYRLMGEIASHRGGMLVDPYLDYDDLELMHNSHITDFMVGPKREPLLEKQLKKSALPVRLYGSNQLHDRYFIPADLTQPVRMIGHSMNGLTKKPTVVVALPDEVSKLMRKTYSKFKKDGRLVYDGISSASASKKKT